MGLRPTTQVIPPDAVEAFLAVGALDEAAALAADMGWGVHEPVTAALVARCRGAVAAARGDHEAALAELSTALAHHDEVSPMPVERGRTLLVLGGVRRRLKQRAAARAALSEALTLFEGAGARLWAERARSELARVSGRAPGPVELTVTETRVVELVTRGLTNREVAAELFVSVRAVESALTKSYAKLGVRSRTELAARLHDRT